MEILSCENVAFKYNESTDYAISDCTFSVKKAKKSCSAVLREAENLLCSGF